MLLKKLRSISAYAEDDEYYTIQAGCTLYSITRKFNTTVSSVGEVNHLSTSILSIGQKLIIPKKS